MSAACEVDLAGSEHESKVAKLEEDIPQVEGLGCLLASTIDRPLKPHIFSTKQRQATMLVLTF